MAPRSKAEHQRTKASSRLAFTLLSAVALALAVTVMRPVAAPAESRAPQATPTNVTTPTPTHPAATVPQTAPASSSGTTATPSKTSPGTSYRSPGYSPSTTYSQYGGTTLPASTTTTAPATTTTTTIAPLRGQIPASPSTLPLTTKKQSGHVSPVFAELSGVGFFVVAVLLGAQALLTRRGRRGPTL